MNNLLSILFYPKKTTSVKSTAAVIYVRLTYNGKRIDFTTSRKIDIKNWNTHSNNAKGNSDESKSINPFFR